VVTPPPAPSAHFSRADRRRDVLSALRGPLIANVCRSSRFHPADHHDNMTFIGNPIATRSFVEWKLFAVTFVRFIRSNKIPIIIL
jgi:hypothetical protein